MTITVINAEVDLPERLMSCKCGRGQLIWNGHYRWGCESPSIWTDVCLFGLSFEAIVQIDSAGVTEAALMGGRRFNRVSFTDYGIELLWLNMRFRKGLVKKEVGMRVDWLTDAEIVALYGVSPCHDRLHEQQGNPRKRYTRPDVRGPIE